MSAVTITTPQGGKVRSASQRRFVVVRSTVTVATGEEVVVVERRSDKVETVRPIAARLNFRSPNFVQHGFIFDTVRKEFVK